MKSRVLVVSLGLALAMVDLASGQIDPISRFSSVGAALRFCPLMAPCDPLIVDQIESTSFAVFDEQVQVLDLSALQYSAFDNRSVQVSTFADTHSNRTGQFGGGSSKSEFSLTFDLDVPREYSLSGELLGRAFDLYGPSTSSTVALTGPGTSIFVESEGFPYNPVPTEIDYTGTLGAGRYVLEVSSGGYVSSVVVGADTSADIIFTVVPEPACATCLLLFLMCLVPSRRVRSR